jgi:hypothetical protein
LVSGVAILLVVAVTGCDRIGASTAATVAGHDISTDRVLSLLRDRKAAADRQSKDGSQTNLVGPGKDTFTKRAFADTLNQIVLAELVKAELKRRHLEVKASDRTSAKSALEQSNGASTIRDLPKGLRTFVLDFAASQAVLRKQVTKKGETKTAQARAQYDKIRSTSPESLRKVCFTGAVFITKAAATTAQQRLKGGASLTAAVNGLQAQQVLTQEQCAAEAQLPTDVQKLGVGAVSAPIANQGTFVVLRVVRRTTFSFADVRAQLEQKIPDPGTAELQAEIGKLVAKAKVHVDPRFGSWNRQAGRVDPPAGTPTTIAPATTPTAPSDGSGSSGGATTTAPPSSSGG